MSAASELESSATYHISSNLTIQDNTYQAYSVETLSTSSDFTQAFAGTPQGTVSGIETYQRSYEASDRVYSIMFGAYFQNSTYGDTTSWTWNDPNLSTFDPAQLETIPIRPLSAPQGTPHPFAIPATTKTVWTPPALIEDPEAAAAEEGEGLTIEGILWSLIPGSSLYDAYQNWKKGEYASFVFNGLTGFVDVATMGAVSKSKAFIKSGIRGFNGVLKQTAKNTKNLMDDGLRLVRGNLDNAGKGLIDDAAGGAKVCRINAEGNQIIGCFAAGTPILTPFGAKSIEEIAPGDWVLAQDESDPEAVPQPRVVEEVFRNLAQMMTLRVGGHTIETTPEHPFWVRGRGWTPAEAIEPGDELRSHDGQWVPLDAKEFSESLIPVFNMRVAEDHTYFVGSPLWGFSVWAHNSYEREYEEYIQRTRGGSGEFKLKTNGRTFDGKLPDGTWYEAKGGFGYLFQQDGSINLQKWSEFTTQIKSQIKEARLAGKRYLLIVRVEPPPRVLQWINRNNVPYEVYP